MPRWTCPACGSTIQKESPESGKGNISWTKVLGNYTSGNVACQRCSDYMKAEKEHREHEQ